MTVQVSALAVMTGNAMPGVEFEPARDAHGDPVEKVASIDQRTAPEGDQPREAPEEPLPRAFFVLLAAAWAFSCLYSAGRAFFR